MQARIDSGGDNMIDLSLMVIVSDVHAAEIPELCVELPSLPGCMTRTTLWLPRSARRLSYVKRMRKIRDFTQRRTPNC